MVMKAIRQKLTIWSAMALMALLPLSAIAKVPEWIDSPDKSGFPLWVSAQAAVPEGQLRAEIFPEATLESLERSLDRIKTYRTRTDDNGKLTQSGNTCVVWSVVNSQPALSPRTTLGRFLDASVEVYSGTITDLAQGFLDGFPGTVLEIAVDNSFKDRSKNTPHRIYVHFQYAEIPIGDEVLCARSSRYPDLPTVDQKILVFQRSRTNRPILHAFDVEIVYAGADGKIASPPEFDIPERDITEIEESLLAHR
jgi:hypothetical protein